MDLTDDDLRSLRGALYIADDERSAEIDTVFEMALAHNAAKRQEPVATVRITGVFAEKQWPAGFSDNDWDALSKLPDGTKLYATPPDLAHNAAKRQEPWYSADIPLEYITKAADGTQFRNVCPLPAHAIAWQVAAPPDLAAKLKEARGLLERAWPHLSNAYDDSATIKNKINDFLSRTK